MNVLSFYLFKQNGLTRFKAPIPEKIFFEMLSICLDLERVSSIVSPSDFEESTLLISFPRFP